MYEDSLVKRDMLDATFLWLAMLHRIHPAYAIVLTLQAHRFHFCGWTPK